jgi:hypothetical protein
MLIRSDSAPRSPICSIVNHFCVFNDDRLLVFQTFATLYLQRLRQLQQVGLLARAAATTWRPAGTSVFPVSGPAVNSAGPHAAPERWTAFLAEALNVFHFGACVNRVEGDW